MTERVELEEFLETAKNLRNEVDYEINTSHMMEPKSINIKSNLDRVRYHLEHAVEYLYLTIHFFDRTNDK